jgi:WD40 repeat protein
MPGPNPLDRLLARVDALDPELAADLRVALEVDDGVNGGPRAQDEAERYVVVRDEAGDPVELGRGGFGRVLRARDARLARDIALKLPRANASVAEIEALAREARDLAALSHPGLLPVHDFFSAGGHGGIVMPIAPGGTLASELTARASGTGSNRPLAELLRAFRRVVEAVRYLHEAGIVHGDIKGANVLLGEHGEVYLHDLGAARTLGNERGEHTSGTPGWMPDAAHPAYPPGVARDIWQLGGLLATICTGASTPAGTDLGIETSSGLSTNAPATNAAAWPSDLAALRTIARLCMTSGGDRIRGPREILEALDAWEDGRTVDGHPYRVTDILRLYLARHRNAVIAGALGLMGTMLAAGEAVRRWDEAEGHLASAIEQQALVSLLGTRHFRSSEGEPSDPAKARVQAIERLRHGPSAAARGVLVTTASEPLSTLEWAAPDLACTEVTIAPNGGRIACVGPEGTAVLEADGTPLAGWSLPAGRARPTWSGDGETLVVVGSGTLERWGAGGRLDATPLRAEEITAHARGPADQIVLGYHDGVIELRDGKTLATRGTFRGWANLPVNGLTFLGGEIVAGCVSDWLRAVDPGTGHVRRILDGEGARFLAAHGDSLVLAGRRAGGDGTLSRLDASNGKVLGTWQADPLDVRLLASDGDRLATAGANGAISVWTPTGTLVTRISTMGKRIAGLALQGDRVVATLQSGGLYTWTLPPEPPTSATHQGPILGLATRDGRVGSYGEEDRIKTWALPRLVSECDVGVPAGHAGGMAFFEDGRAVFGDGHGGVNVLTRSCHLTPVAQLGDARMRGVVLSPDERRLAIGNSHKGVFVLDTATWAVTHTLHLRTNVAGLSFSSDGTRVSVTSYDDEITTLWLTHGGRTDIGVPGGGSRGRLFNGLVDIGITLVAGGRDGELVSWPAGSARRARSWPAHDAAVTHLAHDPNRGIYAAGFGDGRIGVHDEDGQPIAEWAAHVGSVWQVAFTEQGDLVSGGADGHVRSWILADLDTDWQTLREEARSELGLDAKGAEVELVGR